MKKLLALAIIFSFGVADAGIWSSVKNKVKTVGSSIKNTLQNNSGSISTQLQGISGTVLSSVASVTDQKIAQQTTATSTVIANPTVQTELSNVLSLMYETMQSLRQSNPTNTNVLIYGTSLGTTLQACINNPSLTSANLSSITENVGKLSSTSLNQQLTTLNTAVTNFTNSSVTINDTAITTINTSAINATIYNNFLTAISNVQQEILKIQSLYQGVNSTLVTFSTQVNNVLQNCRQTLVVNSTHISAVNLYMQWVKNQGIDVTSLNTALTALNEKATAFNNAVIAANYGVVASSSTGTSALNTALTTTAATTTAATTTAK